MPRSSVADSDDEDAQNLIFTDSAINGQEQHRCEQAAVPCWKAPGRNGDFTGLQQDQIYGAGQSAFATFGGISPPINATMSVTTASQNTSTAARRHSAAPDQDNAMRSTGRSRRIRTNDVPSSLAPSSSHRREPEGVESMSIDFGLHDPLLLFPDTGSTVPYTETTQMQLVEQSLFKNPASSAVEACAFEQGNLRLPSFPWSSIGAGTLGYGTGTASMPDTDLMEGDTGVGETSTPNIAGAAHGKDQSLEVDKVLDMSHVQDAPAHYPITESEVPVVPRSGRLSGRGTGNSPSEPARPSPMSNKRATSRPAKRKATRAVKEDLSDPDDSLVGLPVECYRPRPTKRRATQFVPESIDYSLIPEKAARTKRTKSAQAAFESTLDDCNNMDDGFKCDESSTSSSRAHSRNSASELNQDQTEETVSTLQEDRVISPNETSDKEGSPSALENSRSTITTKQLVKAVLIRPTPAAELSKARRCQTTIFEDHASTTPKSLSLAQQQAQRRAALKDIQKLPSHSDTPESEHNEDNENEGREHATKKGKKLVSKATKDHAVDIPPDQATASVEMQPRDLSNTAGQPTPPPALAMNAQGGPAVSKDTERPSSATTTTVQADAAAGRDENATTSHNTTAHSPIRASSTVPHRVGLSKRQRIQPLLRMTTPNWRKP